MHARGMRSEPLVSHTWKKHYTSTTMLKKDHTFSHVQNWAEAGQLMKKTNALLHTVRHWPKHYSYGKKKQKQKRITSKRIKAYRCSIYKNKRWTPNARLPGNHTLPDSHSILNQENVLFFRYFNLSHLKVLVPLVHILFCRTAYPPLPSEASPEPESPIHNGVWMGRRNKTQY